MEQDNLLHIIPQKRPHSPDSDELEAAALEESSSAHPDHSVDLDPPFIPPTTVRPPKPKRRKTDPEDHPEIEMEIAGPATSRKQQRKDAKKGRKERNRAGRGGEVGMRIDEDEGSGDGFTFRAGLDGGIVI